MKTIKPVLLACAAMLPFVAQAQTEIPLPVQATVKPLALSAAEDYTRQARYPRWSAALEIGAADPLLTDRIPSRQSALGPNGAGPRLAVWASTISALPGETVTLYASLSDTGSGPRSLLEGVATARSAVAGAAVTGELVGYALGQLGTVTYRDDGIAPDSRAGDGIYVAQYSLPSDRAPALGTADSVMVRVAAVLSDEETRVTSGGFQFSNPAARLTGRYTDAVKNGNLVIGAEVEVLAPGRVHLSGTLADTADVPFATAQTAQALQTGKQWVELSFYGLAFHDRTVAGRAKLVSVALTSANGMPNALGPVIGNAHVTQAYSLDRFTRAPFGEPSLLETAKRLQLDASRAPVPGARQ